MDVKVDAAMRWDGVAAVERKRSRRWVTGAAVVLPVLAVTVLSMWFVRAFVVPPIISIPGPMTLAGTPPEPPAVATSTNGRAPVMEAAAEPAQPAAAAEAADAGPPTALPMMQSLALAPPMLTFSPPPPAAAAPVPDSIEPGVPISGPIPLPPRKPRAAAARPAAAAPVPLTPQRPAQ